MTEKDERLAYIQQLGFTEGRAIAGLVEWILQHISIWTSDDPAGPVLYRLELNRYLNIRISLFWTITISVALRSNPIKPAK
jgi:hypothetical protein